MSEIDSIDRYTETDSTYVGDLPPLSAESDPPGWEKASRIALYGFSALAVCAGIPAALSKRKRHIYSPLFDSAPLPAPAVEIADIPQEERPQQVAEKAPRCSGKDAADITEIFTTVANTWAPFLLSKKTRLDSLGASLREHRVHPFEILRLMPKTAIRKILKEGSFAKVLPTINGIQEGMEREIDTLERFAPGLAMDMGKSPARLMPLIQARDWRGVVDYLFDINDGREA